MGLHRTETTDGVKNARPFASGVFVGWQYRFSQTNNDNELEQNQFFHVPLHGPIGVLG